MTGRLRALSAPWLLVALVAALGCGAPDTRIRVVVESDLEAPRELDRVTIQVDARGIGGEVQTATVDLGSGGGNTFPATLGLSHGGGDAPLGPFVITASGWLGDEAAPVVTTSTEASFVAGQETVVTLRLARSCVGVTCGEAERCVAGACVPVAMDGGMPDAGGGADDGGPNDAGSDDAGPDDAGAMGDAGLDAGVDAGPGDAGFDAGTFDAGPAMCTAPLADCVPGGEPCETDTNSSDDHCGACNFACRDRPHVQQARCAGGACELFGPGCNDGWEDCNGDIGLDGCECNLAGNRCSGTDCVPL